MAPKFIDFDAVRALADIEQLAQMLNLPIKKSGQQLRCPCPVHGGDERTLTISPNVISKSNGSHGVFYCQADKKGGDRLALVAHCMELGQQDAAFFIAEQYGTGTVDGTDTVDSTVSQKPGHSAPEQKGRPNAPAPFDPNAFAARLQYSEEVKALGFSQDDAHRLLVGWHPARKMVYLALRNPDGQISGFVGYTNGQLKLPPQWLGSNVVRLVAKTA